MKFEFEVDREAIPYVRGYLAEAAMHARQNSEDAPVVEALEGLARFGITAGSTDA